MRPVFIIQVLSAISLYGPPGSAQTLGNWASCDSGAAQKSSCGFDHPNTAGDAILGWGHFDGLDNSVTSVTDTLGNDYVQLADPIPYGDGQVAYLWVANHVAAGKPYVTVHFARNATHFTLVDLMEVSGSEAITRSNILGTKSGSGSNQSIGPVSTAAKAGIAIGLFVWDGNALPYSAGSGFWPFNYDASSFVEIETKVGSGSVIATTAASNRSDSWAGTTVMVFKAPGNLQISPERN